MSQCGPTEVPLPHHHTWFNETYPWLLFIKRNNHDPKAWVTAKNNLCHMLLHSFYVSFFVFFSLRQSHHVLSVRLPECWGHRCVLPCLALIIFLVWHNITGQMSHRWLSKGIGSTWCGLHVGRKLTLSTTVFSLPFAAQMHPWPKPPLCSPPPHLCYHDKCCGRK